jgi:hypothetical protein
MKILLEADPDCANQTFQGDKKPLHLVSELVNDFNVHQVFQIIKILVNYGACFSCPAHRSDGETPFFVLLKKLARLKDKASSLSIIRYLIQKYPQIGKFQKEECASLMREHFNELIVEENPEKNWVAPTDNWKRVSLETTNLYWWRELAASLKRCEPEFLIRLEIFKQANKNLFADTFLERKFTFFTEDLLNLAIEHDRLESFIEIFGKTLDTVNMNFLVQETLYYERYRILKFLVNHSKVEQIPDSWLLTILQKIDWKLSDDNSCHKCFYILLNHQKFKIGSEPNQGYNGTELRYKLHCAAAESDNAALAMLKRGVALGTRDHTEHLMIEYLDDDVLRKFLDSCITTRKSHNLSDNDFFLTIDYSFLESPKEMLPIEYISEAPHLRQLIVHPVISSFLFLKWFQLSNVFYLNLFLFSLITMSSSLFLVIYYVNFHQASDDTTLEMILKYATIISFAIFLLKEMGQFLSSKMAYLRSVENYFEIGLIGVLGMALFTHFGDNNDEFRRVITAIFIMGIAFEWTLMFSALPMFTVTNYIILLKKVAVSFLRMLAFYSVILMAFALSFYTLMGAHPHTLGNATAPSVDTTIFQIVLMMTGDFGINTDANRNVLAFRIFLIIFILSVTIVLMNLLLGLTISDTAAIESQAELYNWLDRTKQLSKYETMVSNW